VEPHWKSYPYCGRTCEWIIEREQQLGPLMRLGLDLRGRPMKTMSHPRKPRKPRKARSRRRKIDFAPLRPSPEGKGS
jgi:hypothetical protein